MRKGSIFPVKERFRLSCRNLKFREVISNLNEVKPLIKKVLAETKRLHFPSDCSALL